MLFITFIYYAHNKKLADGFKIVEQVLKTNYTITKFGIFGMLIFKKGIDICVIYSILDNIVDEERAKIIGEALKSNSTLTELQVWGNEKTIPFLI